MANKKDVWSGEHYMKKRPPKKVYSVQEVEELRKRAIEKIKTLFLPDEKIIKIYLIGSSIKNNFGKYEPPGFRGSLYSDFDFIIFVEDDYKIPGGLIREPDGKPFQRDEMDKLAYRIKNFIDNKHDAETFFIRRKNMYDKQIQEEGEYKKWIV